MLELLVVATARALGACINSPVMTNGQGYHGITACETQCMVTRGMTARHEPQIITRIEFAMQDKSAAVVMMWMMLFIPQVKGLYWCITQSMAFFVH
jgi:hypothetical protein